MGDDGADDDGIAVVHDGSVVRVALHRPATKNAITESMVVALRRVVSEVSLSDDCRVMVISSSGADFCTGVDVVRANTVAPDAARPRVGNHERRMEYGVHALLRELWNLQIPVVTSVPGWAAGIGCSLAVSGDFCVASTTARFWLPFTSRGFSPDSGSTYILPRLIGVARAKEMIMLGRVIEGTQAAEWGMIHRAVEPERLAVTTEELVQELAAAATVSVGIAKSLVHRNLDTYHAAAMANEAFGEEVSLRSDDFKEGLAAFRERRDPDYTGR